MCWRRAGVALAAALWVLWAGAAAAKPLQGDDFERGVGERAGAARKETPHGPGWRPAASGDVAEDTGDYLRYPAAGLLRPAGGTIEIELVRDNDPEQTEEALFTLEDEQGRALLVTRLWWRREPKGPEGRQSAEVQVYGAPRIFERTVKVKQGRAQQVVTDTLMPIPAVKRGQKVHVALTWGPEGVDLFVNGQPVGEARRGAQRSVADLVRRAAWLVVGAEPDRGRSYSQVHSVVKAFYAYDRPLNGKALYANPGRFRPEASVPPQIASVEHDADRVAGFSGKLVAGNSLGVTVRGEAGAKGSFDVVHYPDLGGKLEVDWRGWGVYLEEKSFYGEGEVNLRDVREYEVYAATAPFDALAPGMEPAARLKVGEQRYTFSLLAVDVPYYVAVVAQMRDGTVRPVIAPVTKVALSESEPGVYTGSWTVGYRDRFARAAVVGRLEKSGLSAVATAGVAFGVDPSLTVAVATEPSELRADEKSTSRVTVTVTDANGSAVSGHKVKFLLATTSQYTGVVGGGAFAEQVGGAIKADAWGETDLFGKVSATYVAGFAAKTAVIVARDMASDDTGAGWVKTYIQTTAQLELEPATEVAAAAEGYAIEVRSSDEWLTADGRSQARITARVTLNGRPVEGHKVGFDVAAGTGSVRVVKDTTGADGEARAVYTAGTKIGMVLVTATDHTVGISGSVQIELRSDAPAKIRIRIEPEKLPADGRSRAELLVQVTDINDNPNDNVEVEYRLAEGGGRLAEERGKTDRRGESANEYTAGRDPGRVSIEITVRSTVPTEEELAKARSLALAVTDYDFF